MTHATTKTTAAATQVKCPQCAAALAARKMMMGCDVCRGTGWARKASAAKWNRENAPVSR